MTMVIENQGRQYGNMGYPESVYSGHLHSQPQFTDPWGSSSSSHAPSYATSMSKPESRSMPLSFPQLTSTAPSLPTTSYTSNGYGNSDMQNIPHEIPRSTYSSEPSYQATAHNTSPYPSSNYSSMNYAQSLHQQQQQQQSVRKMSDHSEHSSRAEAPSFGELDASRGMLALSHQNLTDLTPRNIYEARTGQAADGYGFPPSSQHSLSSSISGPSSHRDSYPYYSASVASADSHTDYSSAASDAGFDSMAATRTLPRPQQLIGANLGPPAPQSMMGQFSSKMSSNTQKKHKCKVCDKRFTRPSSLQTHMYSHTGEKPFACSVEGCGRHFSVVSNLRRHKKVHKGEAVSSGHSEEDD